MSSNAENGSQYVHTIYPNLIQLTGSVECAYILSRIIYWSKKTADEHGWVYKSYQDWEQETTLKRRKIDAAKQQLLELGLIETVVKKTPNGVPTLHYRLTNMFNDKLQELTNLSVGKSNNPTCTKCTSPLVQNVQMDLYKTYKSIYTRTRVTNKGYQQVPLNICYFFEEILKSWNSQNIISHRKINKTTQLFLSDVFKNHTPDEFLSAIRNYGQILHSAEHYFSHKYTLEQFVRKGLTEGKGYMHFLDSNNPFDKFKKFEVSSDPWDIVRKNFNPVTEPYEHAQVADYRADTYYGFSLRYIRDPWDYVRNAEQFINSQVYNKSGKINNFTTFWTIEVALAGLLYNRKTHRDQIELAERLLEVWKRHKDTYS